MRERAGRLSDAFASLSERAAAAGLRQVHRAAAGAVQLLQELKLLQAAELATARWPAVQPGRSHRRAAPGMPDPAAATIARMPIADP